MDNNNMNTIKYLKDNRIVITLILVMSSCAKSYCPFSQKQGNEWTTCR